MLPRRPLQHFMLHKSKCRSHKGLRVPISKILWLEEQYGIGWCPVVRLAEAQPEYAIQRAPRLDLHGKCPTRLPGICAAIAMR